MHTHWHLTDQFAYVFSDLLELYTSINTILTFIPTLESICRYCVRAALWAFNWQMPQEVIAHAGAYKLYLKRISFSDEPGGCRKHNLWTARVKSIKNYIYSEFWRQELSIGIYMGRIGEGGGFSFFAGGLQFFSAAILRNCKYVVGILSSSLVDWHPFWAIRLRGGVCGHVQKSEAHALRCRPRGESSQRSSN